MERSGQLRSVCSNFGRPHAGAHTYVHAEACREQLNERPVLHHLADP
jgi:hypothetical protein